MLSIATNYISYHNPAALYYFTMQPFTILYKQRYKRIGYDRM